MMRSTSRPAIVVLVAAFDPCVAIRTFDDLEGRDSLVLLRGRVVELTADQALDGVEREVRVGHGLAAGRHADQAFAAFGEGNHGRGCARAFGILDDLRLAAFHDGDTGVCGPEVDTNNLAHTKSLSP